MYKLGFVGLGKDDDFPHASIDNTDPLHDGVVLVYAKDYTELFNRTQIILNSLNEGENGK